MYMGPDLDHHRAADLLATQYRTILGHQQAKCYSYSYTCGPFYEHGLTLILAWISNYTHYNVWGEINYPFLNFNGTTVEV